MTIRLAVRLLRPVLGRRYDGMTPLRNEPPGHKSRPRDRARQLMPPAFAPNRETLAPRQRRDFTRIYYGHAHHYPRLVTPCCLAQNPRPSLPRFPRPAVLDPQFALVTASPKHPHNCARRWPPQHPAPTFT